jgi:ribosomal protein S12 methylthiotransferase accessory factor
MMTWRTLAEQVTGPAGLIRLLEPSPVPAGAPWLHLYRAELAAPLAYPRSGTPFRFARKAIRAAGAGFDRDRAIWCVLGEAMERHAACAPVQDREIIATARDIGPSAMPPDRWILYGDDQYGRTIPYRRPAPGHALAWIEGFRLPDGEPIHIPSDFVWLQTPFLRPEDTHIQPISTGLSVGADRWSAILGGLLEIIERDVFSCHWLARRPARRCRPAEDALRQRLGSRLAANWPVELYLLDNEFDLPVFLGRSRVRAHPEPDCLIGGSAHPDPLVAAEKAAVEAIQTRLWAGRMAPRSTAAADVRTFLDHVLYHQTPERATEAAWLFAGEALDTLPEGFFDETPEAMVRRICRRLQVRGFEACVVDLTGCDLSELGLHAVRVCVPGLQPLSCGAGFENRDPRRLQSFVAAHGAPFTGFNPAPHPFP